jgi:hypothetical protein
MLVDYQRQHISEPQLHMPTVFPAALPAVFLAVLPVVFPAALPTVFLAALQRCSG